MCVFGFDEVYATYVVSCTSTAVLVGVGPAPARFKFKIILLRVATQMGKWHATKMSYDIWICTSTEITRSVFVIHITRHVSPGDRKIG